MKLWSRFVFTMMCALLSESVIADAYHDATAGRGKEITAAYFGVHFHRLQLVPGEKAIPTQWPPVAFGAVRLWDSRVRWADIAPRAGVWEFNRMDALVETATEHHASLLYTLGSTPRWASARPGETCPYGSGCAAEAINIGHWDEYVRRIAQRYGNRIAAYELWNEPNFSDIDRDRNAPGFYTGSIANMIEMARHARRILDEVSPEAKLCTPGFVNGSDRLERFLEAGGSKSVQAVCYHFYSGGSADFVRQILDVRAIMQRTGVSALPLWNTETGVDTLRHGDAPSGIAATTDREAVARLSQMLILGAAVGLEHFYYYAWDNERSGMVTTTGQHLFGYQVLMQLQSWLLGTRLVDCSAIADVVRCEGTRAHDQFLVMWSGKDAMHTIKAPSGWKIAGVDHLSGNVALPGPSGDKVSQSLVLGSEPVRVRLVRATNP